MGGTTDGFEAIEGSDEAFDIFSWMHGTEVKKVGLPEGIFISDQLSLGGREGNEGRVATIAGDVYFVGRHLILLLNISCRKIGNGDDIGGVM